MKSQRTSRKVKPPRKGSPGLKNPVAGKKVVAQPRAPYFRQWFENSPDPVEFLDSKGLIIETNNSFLKLYGYSAKETVGQRMSDLIVPPKFVGEAKKLLARIAHDETVVVETERLRKNGSTVYVSIIGFPIKLGGDRIGICFVHRDITAFRQAQEAVKETQLRYRRLVESANDVIYTADPAGHFVYANPVALKVTGYSEKEILGKSYLDLISPPFRAATEAFYKQQMAAKTENTYNEFPILAKQGHEVWLGQHVQLIRHDGNIIGVQAVARDITKRRQVEEALRESEERFRLLAENSTDMISRHTPEGAFVYVSPACRTLLGFEASELVGRSIYELFHPYDLDDARRVHKDLLDLSGVTTATYRLRKKDGSYIWVESTSHSIRTSGTEAVIEIQSVSRDVTLRKLTEEALRESESRLQYVIDTVNDGITFSDERGHFDVFNKTMEKLTGYTREEANAGDFSALLYPNPEDRQRALDGLKVLLEKKRVREVESTICTKSGELRTVLTTTSLLEAHGKKMFLSAYHDITIRKRVENALEESEARFRELYNDAPIGYHELDYQGRIVRVNRRELEMLGYASEEMVGKFIWDFLKDPLSSRAAVQAKLSGKLVPKGSYERMFVRKNGSEIPVLVEEQLRQNEMGQVTGIRTTIQDITEQKLAEKALHEAKEAAEAATLAKSQFLAMMSHEIRTPMNGVIGMTDLLLTTDLTDEQREYVETVRTSGESLLAIINDILDFSKIESGKIELERHPFELKDAIEEVFELLAPKAIQKSLDLLYWIDPRVPAVVQGDKLRLRQILFNLVGNAIKFTERGEVYASVTLDSKVENDCQLTFSVRDTGIGIPKDRLDRLFKAFSQVDSSTTRKYGGTGLGLAISMRLAEMMGGKIWVESKEGKGATFFFGIKVSIPSDSLILPKVVVRGKVPELQNKRVLLVDDNETNIDVLRRQCEYWGMIPRASTSPEEILGWIRSGDPFDVAILDMLMPNMNGVQLAKELRSIRPKETLPLLLLSSSGANHEELKENPYLFASIISKPVKQEQLFHHIVEAIAGVKQPVRSPKIAELPKQPASPLRILIAEDSKINQKLIVHILRQLGYQGVLVSNGREVLRELEKQNFDLILMDVHMPEMDGLETTRRIVTERRGKRIPTIIALTADAMQGDREKCIQAGMDDYVSKPIRLDDVRRVLERWSPKALGKTTHDTLPASDVGQDPLQAVMNRLHENSLDDEPEFLAGFLTVAIDDIRKKYDELVKAYQEGDIKVFFYTAHSLKGGASNLGTTAFADMCAQIEESAGTGSFEEYAALADRFETECRKLLNALTILRDKYKTQEPA
ncbi:MAG: PAS domain S-box protein [Bacteroidota bacterium]